MAATGRRRGSRHSYEDSTVQCPQECGHPRGMRLVTHHTGEFTAIDVPGGVEMVEITERYYECRGCGWTVDA